MLSVASPHPEDRMPAPSHVSWFTRLAKSTSRLAGRPLSFALAAAIIAAWLLTGPLFGFSDTWQLVINTGTTIVTFLMVFLIQRAQNKDALAIQLKLNELVAAVKGASNRLIDVEDLGEDELRTLHQFYAKLAVLAKNECSIEETHSLHQAGERHVSKHRVADHS